MGFDSIFRSKGGNSKNSSNGGHIAGRPVNVPFKNPVPGVIDSVVDDPSVDLSTKLTWIIHLKDLGALGSPVDHPTVVRAFEIAKARAIQSLTATLPESATTDSEDMQAAMILAENCRARAASDPQWAREKAASEAAWELTYEDRTVGFGPGRTLGLRMFVHERDSSVIVKAVSGMAVSVGARVGDVVIAIDGVFLFDAAMEAVRQGRGSRAGQVLSGCIKELALAHDRNESPLPIVLRHYRATPTNQGRRSGGGGGSGGGSGAGIASVDLGGSGMLRADTIDSMTMGRPGTAFAARQGAKQDIQENNSRSERAEEKSQLRSSREHTGDHGNRLSGHAGENGNFDNVSKDTPSFAREKRDATDVNQESTSHARFSGDRAIPQPPPRRLAAISGEVPPPRRLEGLDPMAGSEMWSEGGDEDREERRRRKHEKRKKKKDKHRRNHDDLENNYQDDHPVFRPLDGPADPFKKYAALPALPALDRRR